MKKFLVPALIALALTGLSWLMRDLPASTIIFLRFVIGYFTIAGLVYLIQRGTRNDKRTAIYERMLKEHRQDIRDLIQKGEDERKVEIQALMEQTAKIAKELAETTRKKDEVVSQTTATHVTEILGAIKEGTEAAHAATQEANHANKKIEALQKVIHKTLDRK